MLSWAYIIHKSQGKTLDKVVIDLGTTEKMQWNDLGGPVSCLKTTNV